MSLLDAVRSHRRQPLVQPTFVDGRVVTGIPDLLHVTTLYNEALGAKVEAHRVPDDGGCRTACKKSLSRLGVYHRREVARRRPGWGCDCWTGARCATCTAPLARTGLCVMCLSASLDEDDRIRRAES